MIYAICNHSQCKCPNFGYGLFPCFAVRQDAGKIGNFGNPTPSSSFSISIFTIRASAGIFILNMNPIASKKLA